MVGPHWGLGSGVGWDSPEPRYRMACQTKRSMQGTEVHLRRLYTAQLRCTISCDYGSTASTGPGDEAGFGANGQ